MTPAEGAEHHVVRQVHVAYQAHAKPVLRHEGQGYAHLGNAQRVLAQKLFPLSVILHIADAAGLHRLQAGNGLQQLLLSAAGDAGNAQDLAAVGGEGHVVQLQHPVDAAHRQVFHLDAGFGGHRLRPLDIQRDGVAHHHVGHFLGVGGLGGHVADKLAVAQDGHPVRQLLHLVHLVGDDHDGLAVVPHVAEHGEELVRLLRGQDRGGLVQDQDVRAPVQHLDDLHCLLLGDGHVVYLLIGIHLKAVLVADILYLLRGGLQIQLSLLLQAQNNIFRGGEHVHQLEVLVHHADSQIIGVLGGADDHFLAVDTDLALVREIDAGEHIHQSGLAAAVFAQQRQDLSPVNVQPYLVVGHYGAKGLGNVPHFYCGDFVVQEVHSPYDNKQKSIILQRAARRRMSLRCPLQQ